MAPGYTVRRSSRARHVRLRMERDGELVVVLPEGVAEEEAGRAVQELGPWVARRREALAAASRELAVEPGTVPFLDERLAVVAEPGRRRVHRSGDELLVPAGPQAGPAAERWYRRQARAEAQARLARACGALGVAHGAVSIRDQRSRWGSCASSGAISLNWRLMLAPSTVFGYVVWHEACHLVVADHSPRFWGLLEGHLPGYREPREWLRRYGTALSLPPLWR
ncbi:MAG: M48 family metallopeptidase [Solirubrobacterales bacterium]